MCGPVAQWKRHLTSNQGIPGSSPGGVVYFCLSSIFNTGDYSTMVMLNHQAKNVLFFSFEKNA